VRRELASAGIALAGLKRQHLALSADLHAAFERVLSADGFILGREVDAFESEFAAYCDVSHCSGVASGTVALTLALTAAGIGQGDEVIVPGNTFIASALAPLHAGATPVFCDVEADTGLLDVASAELVITERTAAIIPVHLYGQACDMAAISSLARRHGLFVLEDAAHAHGATWRGERTGRLGDAAAFSFYPSKNLGALGEAGAVCTSDAALAEKVSRLRDMGRGAGGGHVELGYNERLHGLQAAFLRAKLPHLDAWNRERRAHAARYQSLLSKQFGLLRERADSPCVYYAFPCRHAARVQLAEALAAAQIQTRVHYSPGAHRHPAFEALPASSRPLALPNTDAWAQTELSLPMFAELRDDEVERVAEVCNQFVDDGSSLAASDTDGERELERV
jgi:dTDP-3-amino-3,4,6-trideoxy-alpha-D-glucose transaminase